MTAEQTINVIQTEKTKQRQHSLPLPQILLLHLLPGTGVILFYLLAAPVAARLGYPPSLGLMFSFLLVGMPFELAYLAYQGKRRNGTLILREVIQYRRPMPAWQYAIIFASLVVISFAVLFLVTPATNFLASRVFFGLPGYLLPGGDLLYGSPTRKALLVTLFIKLFMDGIANPIVEELYFRGYLLPSLSHLGWFAPVINTLLFTLGHFWQPYNYPLIFLTVLPEVAIVWKKQNIYLSIMTHCAANTLGALLSLASFFAHP